MATFDAYLSRKRIKNINLRIDRQGTVKVSAPLQCPLNTIQQFLLNKQAWILAHQNRLRQHPLPTKQVTHEQKQRLQNVLPPLIQKWQAIVGVQANQWNVRAMTSRWGSCHPTKKRICLNAHLIHYPLVCLEYVLVHELVHLLEASHNQRFHALMSQFMPEWKAYKKLLTPFDRP